MTTLLHCKNTNIHTHKHERCLITLANVMMLHCQITLDVRTKHTHTHTILDAMALHYHITLDVKTKLTHAHIIFDAMALHYQITLDVRIKHTHSYSFRCDGVALMNHSRCKDKTHTFTMF